MEASLTDMSWHKYYFEASQIDSNVIHKEGTRDYHKKSNTPVQVDDFEKGEEVWTQAAGGRDGQRDGGRAGAVEDCTIAIVRWAGRMMRITI